jgi:AbrB family looped-hinge helix DNA binding protein
METTVLSTKGQIILPKGIRESRAWKPGTKFMVEEREDGVLLRPAARIPRTTLADVAGCLKYKGKAKTIEQMDEAIAKEVKRRHDRSRH